MAAFAGPATAAIRILMHLMLNPRRAPTLYARMQLYVAPLVLASIMVVTSPYRHRANHPCAALLLEMKLAVEDGTIASYWYRGFFSRWFAFLLCVMLYMYLNRDWLLPLQALIGVVSVLALGIFPVAVFTDLMMDPLPYNPRLMLTATVTIPLICTAAALGIALAYYLVSNRSQGAGSRRQPVGR